MAVKMPEVSQAETVAMLGEVPIFRGLTKRQLAGVAKLVDHASFEPGAVIVKQGQSGIRLVIFRTGTAAVIRGEITEATGLEGRGRRLSTVGPGDIVGELSLIDGWPTSASVVAETPVDALVLYRTRFNKLLESTPQLYPRLLTTMAERLRATNQRDGDIA